MRKLLLIGGACLAIGASAPAPLPVAQPMTAGDRAAGAKAHPQLLAEFGGLYEGPQAAYVTKVGQKIAMQSGLANTQSAFTVSLLNSSVSSGSGSSRKYCLTRLAMLWMSWQSRSLNCTAVS